ncbi:3-dehydroquinate synthase [Alicyclobacillus dauci]|uniref:3-dehydroquinate synthase n=1 Tax=Alicyclobacillus dauci TaxID=1475485 RepID=A0ABY6YXL5_9BACL|nr:3-dehydroquinate synthase [Alicyclobacillus dauci]WAH35122.1 3-dehydroquinate synthase [Alicyclobacillus dauci]
MRRIEVRSAAGTYPIMLGADVFTQAGSLVLELGFRRGTKVTIITDDTVASLPFADTVLTSLDEAGFVTQTLTVPAGDSSKSMDMAIDLYRGLLKFGMRRSDLVVALGGGVVGDLAGFVAATYLRGIAFVQAPTTLLAHDSSIGGKVGINLPEGKNLVGAFYPPRAVLYDLSALRYLPVRQWTNGMAEVIKHGIIANPELFANLEAKPLTECPLPDTLEPILAAAIQVKVDVVQADERESGRRQVLNVGHTIGHAIEQRSHYQLGHGEAISIGMVLETKLAQARNLLAQADALRIVSVLEAHGLPVRTPADEFSELRGLIDVDKKHGSALWTFALPVAIGDVRVVSDVRPEEVEAVYVQSLRAAVRCQGHKLT